MATYIITATHRDGRPFQTAADRNLHSTQPSAFVASTPAERDAKVREIHAAGLTPHVKEN